MRKLNLPVLFVLLSILVSACNHTETYAEKKERESSQINDFLSSHDIKTIRLDDFLKDTVTNNPETGPDSTLNEYVLIPDNGVYMQIVRRGTGKPLKAGEVKMYNYRFLEYNIATGDTIDLSLYQNDPDVMKCSRTGDYYSATLVSGRMQRYGQAVPNGWLVAFPYIQPGCLNGSASAKVKLIVPHSMGTSTAMNAVEPYYYELIITAQKYDND